MSIARKDCIWYEQCGSECFGRCEDYSPTDESEDNEAFYRGVLAENAKEYKKVIQDYSDGSDRFES